MATTTKQQQFDLSTTPQILLFPQYVDFAKSLWKKPLKSDTVLLGGYSDRNRIGALLYHNEKVHCGRNGKLLYLPESITVSFKKWCERMNPVVCKALQVASIKNLSDKEIERASSSHFLGEQIRFAAQILRDIGMVTMNKLYPVPIKIRNQKMNKTYIIDLVKVSYSGELEKSWHFTTTNLKEATVEYERLMGCYNCVAAALTEWQPGDINKSEKLIHGSYGSRSCAGGIPTQKVLRHGDRSFMKINLASRSTSIPKHLNPSGALEVYYVTLDDWQDNKVDLKVTTQPSPGFKLSHRKLSDKQEQILWRGETAFQNENKYWVSWVSALGCETSKTVSINELDAYKSLTDFKAEKITFTPEDKQILNKIMSQDHRSVNVPSSFMALSNLIRQQVKDIKELLEEEIKTGHFSIICKEDGTECTVKESVEMEVFQENDIVDGFLEHNSTLDLTLEDLRDIQHDAINSIEDVICQNQEAKNKAVSEMAQQDESHFDTPSFG